MVCAMLLVSLCACSFVGEDTAFKSPSGSVSNARYDTLLATTTAVIASQTGIPAEDEAAWNEPMPGTNKDMTVKEYCEVSTLFELEQIEFYSKKAKEMNLEMDEEVYTYYKDYISKILGEERLSEYSEKLSAAGDNIDDIYKTYAYAVSGIQKLSNYDDIINNITDKQVEDRFNQNLSNFVGVKLIMIGYGEESRSEEEALDIVNNVYELIKSYGGSVEDAFAEAIDKYSDTNEEPDAKDTLTYMYGSDEVFEYFDYTVRDLDEGEYTKEPIKSDIGYIIALRTAPEIPEDYTLEEQKDNIKQELAGIISLSEFVDWRDGISYNKNIISDNVRKLVDKSYYRVSDALNSQRSIFVRIMNAVKNNLVVSIVIAIVVIALIVLIIFLIIMLVKNSKKKKEFLSALEAGEEGGANLIENAVSEEADEVAEEIENTSEDESVEIAEEMITEEASDENTDESTDENPSEDSNE